mgnify:FL=1
MDAQSIGKNAGIVWRLLDHNRKWEYNELKEATGLSDRDLNAAIGWLAREDKIQFETSKKDGHDYLFLELNLYIG